MENSLRFGRQRIRPRRRFAYSGLAFAGLSLLGGACSSSKNNGVSFKFDRPELVELACIDNTDRDNPVPLPIRCCSPTSGDEPLAEQGSQYLVPIADGSPLGLACAGKNAVPHALVSQSVRGEVAAVDLDTGDVLDSDQQIPGYTFLDVGGLPTAIVVPPERPTPGYEPALGESVEGPPWTYVASGADNSVRALATCRFRSGKPCGPEAGPTIIVSDEVELFLPATPFDMFMGPDEALWVSLPEKGLLARIQVAPRMDAPPVPPIPSDSTLPFLTNAGPDAGAGSNVQDPTVQVPADPSYYRVPAPTSFDVADPVDDVPPYLAFCGLGYEYSPAEPELPKAPRVPPSGAVAPGLLRYDTVSGLLFVTDLNLPVLHVFSLNAQGDLVTRGSVPVGVPLTTIALSPYVPVEDPDLFAAGAISDPTAPPELQKRFLYGLDANGMLLAFELKTSSTGASVKPIKAPVPDRYQDRLLMQNRSAVGAALEVVDTRLLSPDNCGVGKDGVEVMPVGKTSIVTQLQDQLNAAKDELSAAEKSKDQARINAATVQRNIAQRHFEIARDAGPKQLRGVFLIVATMSGELNVFDILDLDVKCRAQTSCSPTAAGDQAHPLLEGDQVQSGTTPLALSVQRNAPRLTLGQEPTITVSSTSAFKIPRDPTTGVLGCRAPYVGTEAPVVTETDQVDDGMGGTKPQEVTGALICVPPDPWAERDQTWTAQTNAIVPGLALLSAVFEQTRPDGTAVPEDQLIVRAPAGVSLCGRGAQAGVDDVLVVPADNPESRCPAATSGSEPRLKIIEAHDDYLVVRALGGTNATDAELDDAVVALRPDLQAARTIARDAAVVEVMDLQRCFPTFVNVEVRTGNSLVVEPCAADGTCVAPTIDPVYLVTGTISGYLHRTIVGPDGTCIPDPEKDARYTARTRVGQYFENTQVGFTLSSGAGTVASVALAQGTTVLRDTIVSASLPSARPATIRFFPYANELFLVDSATQGLRRLDLSPFRPDPDAIYR